MKQEPGVIGVREAAARRLSIRSFTPTPVAHADLFAILATSSQAPSAFNLQPWRFIVVERDDLKFALAEALSQYPQALSAPALIVLYTDTADAIGNLDDILDPRLPAETRDRTRSAVRRTFAGKSDGERETWGAQQGHIALGYLLLAAEEQGYQAFPMLSVDAGQVRLVLDLPHHAHLVAVVAIGFGAECTPPPQHHALERIVRFT